MGYNIAICDDDILYMNKVKEMIEQWGKDNNEDVSVYLFNHGDALINSYQKSKIDVIFLDIAHCWISSDGKPVIQAASSIVINSGITI